jgi:hypothetical protein
MLLKSINAIPLMLRLMHLLLVKAIFIALKISLIGAILLYSSARYFILSK